MPKPSADGSGGRDGSLLASKSDKLLARAVMQVLWAPWRMAYVGGPKPSGCIFCTALTTPDLRASLVLVQRPAIVMLNRYPYASAHLMVAPQRHAPDLGRLPAAEFQALMAVLQRAAALVSETYHPEGMNIGMNLGGAAGAGVTDHLHWHIVPRWNGDTNFMPMLAEVHVIPEHLEATYDRLRPLFAPLASDAQQRDGSNAGCSGGSMPI